MLLCFYHGIAKRTHHKDFTSGDSNNACHRPVTDIGIEIGKLLYWNYDQKQNEHSMVRANREKLRLRLALVFAFFAGV